MELFWQWRERLRRLFFRNRVEREIEDEMRHHLAMEAREHVNRGMDPAAAKRAARVDFGSVERYRAEARDVRWGSTLDVLAQDLRYASRRLRTRPGFTAVTLITLALGIGASTAVFSLVNALLLRPLPYSNADAIAWIATRWEGSPRASISPAEFFDYRDRLGDVFSSVGVYAYTAVNASSEGEPQRLRAAGLSAQVLPALGVVPTLGRGFSEEEDRTAASVVLLSDSLWRQHFGATADVLGRKLHVNGREREVIGVLPQGFELPEAILAGSPTLLYLPMGIDPAEVTDRGSHYLSGVARLRDGVTLRQASSALEALTISFETEYPEDYLVAERFRATAIPLADQVRGPVQGPILFLAAAVAFVLLITCANVAGLLLARADRREKELSLRSALGASRARLASQVIVESTLLALAGGALGLLVAQGILVALGQLLPVQIPWLAELRLSGRVLGFAATVSAATALLFGLLPALDASRARMAALKEGTTPRRGQRLRKQLVVAEVALALVLLTGAGLLTRSFLHLLDVDPGFRTDAVATTRLTLPFSAYSENSAVVSFYRELTESLAGAPGVTEVGAVSNLPLATRLGDMNFEIEGRPTPEGVNMPAADWQVITPSYFDAMGLTLLRGRGIAASDREGSVGVVVINETFANLHWPDDEALGARFRLGGTGTRPEVAEVVGVVRDVRHESLAQEQRPQMYFAHEQFRFWNSGRAATSMSLAVQSPLPLAEVRRTVRQAVSALDADLPLSDFRSMAEVRHFSVAVPRLLMTVMAAFSVVAFLLAAVGIYGVMAYAVSKRIPEIGIRLALGARPSDVSRMVMAQGARLAALGIALGLVGVLLMTRAIADLLYGVSPADPVTLIGAAGLLALAALLACYSPTLRAIRVDPVSLLRAE